MIVNEASGLKISKEIPCGIKMADVLNVKNKNVKQISFD